MNKIIDRRKFTLEKYEEFLQSISKYKVLPLNEFRNYHNDKEVVIGLRHDSDENWPATMNMLQVEFQHNIRSTVFVLHSSMYFSEPTFIRDLHKAQSGNFEIALHNDCMTYLGPKGMMHQSLKKLRDAGLIITGTSAHGDKKHKNIHFWEQFNKADFGIEYESYELDHNLYFSDCTFINGHRWHPDMIDWNEINPGSRIQVLIHPEHFHI